MLVSDSQNLLYDSAYNLRAVIDMVDWERHDITHMLKTLPNVTNRVIGVINKCDLKFPKANEFVSSGPQL